MKKYGKKGFTLIELIAVLVIMAIIALIATPLVMNIIRKSKISARKRSVDAYGRSVELAIASYLLDTGTFPTDLHSLTIEYSGNTVVCNVMQMKENGGLYMSECSVNNVEVKDDSTDDGWYHYGTRDITNEEYVDMYGKNVEDALKTYHDTNDAYPEAIDTLTIESVGKTVACESSVNYDGTVYLTNCKVDGVSVADTNQEDGYYHYGKIIRTHYDSGDEVVYNDVNYYVLHSTDENEGYLDLIKAVPLLKEELELYVSKAGCGNIYDNSEAEGTNRIYGQMSYGNNSNFETSCVKSILDLWAIDNVEIASLNGIRLITYDELLNDFGFEYYENNITNFGYQASSSTPNWIFSNEYVYWTMTPRGENNVYKIKNNGKLIGETCNYYRGNSSVRPVITIKKSAL